MSWLDINSYSANLHPYLSKVRPTLPPASFFKLPPSNIPKVLPPPSDHPTLAAPFSIPIDIYNAALNWEVPVTIAIVYVTIVSILNQTNKRRKFRPWSFSQTRLFHLLVVIHNVILTVYSAWTFVGMFHALKNSIERPSQNPWHLAGTVDSFCKINGPRGMGNAAIYNATSSAWGIANRFFHLGADGLTPETTDVGRLWNEGLAFYGWLFYLSKFYEVIDTLIILAKGKKSSFLQTYHHAGAMLCMWAGIRYMSPPIWMFVFLNSFIHTLMYSFYFCSAVGIAVPARLKKSLTTMQITQFVLGVIFAFSHLFIKYQSPISVPYLYHLGDFLREAPSSASSVASSMIATATADQAAWLKKLALRAAGREGLAQNVRNSKGETFGIDARHAIQDYVRREETRYRDEIEWLHCLDTSGQTFAILLNVVYLIPLTALFIRFFIKSYLSRLQRRRSSTAVEIAHHAAASFGDAGQGAIRKASEAFAQEQEGTMSDDDDFAIVTSEDFEKEVKASIDQVRATTTKLTNSAKKSTQRIARDTQETANAVKEKVTNETKAAAAKAQQVLEKDIKPVVDDKVTQAQTVYEEDVKPAAANAVQATKEKGTQAVAETQKAAQATRDIAETVYEEDIKPAVAKANETAQATYAVGKQKAGEIYEEDVKPVIDNTEATAEKVKEEDIKPAVNKAARETSKAAENAQETTSSLIEEGKSFAEAAKGEVNEKTSELTSKVESAAEDVQASTSSNKSKAETGVGNKSPSKIPRSNKSQQSQNKSDEKSTQSGSGQSGNVRQEQLQQSQQNTQTAESSQKELKQSPDLTQASWVDVKDEAYQKTAEAANKATGTAKEAASKAEEEGELWFEKLSKTIDSPQKSSENISSSSRHESSTSTTSHSRSHHSTSLTSEEKEIKREERILAESEMIRDEPVEDPFGETEKKEEDKILASTKAGRDHDLDQDKDDKKGGDWTTVEKSPKHHKRRRG